jgi:hypothetical protein
MQDCNFTLTHRRLAHADAFPLLGLAFSLDRSAKISQLIFVALDVFAVGDKSSPRPTVLRANQDRVECDPNSKVHQRAPG